MRNDYEATKVDARLKEWSFKVWGYHSRLSGGFVSKRSAWTPPSQSLKNQMTGALCRPIRWCHFEIMRCEFSIQTRGPGIYEFTLDVNAWLTAQKIKDGVLTLFVRHTSCSLLVQENADPDVQRDLQQFLERLVPPANDPAMSYLTHTYEGPDDMPAHIKAALLPVSLVIPVFQGRLVFGAWQGIYLFEHRNAPHTRKVAAHLIC